MSLKDKEEIEQETLPFEMVNVPLIYKEKAQKELNESLEEKFRGLKEIKEMAKAHEKTCDIDFVDDFLLQFLRHRKFNAERAFKQLLNFTEFRILHREWFDCREKDIFSSPSKQYFSILPRRTPDGCTIFLAELNKWDPDDVSVEDIKREMVMLFGQANRYAMTQINGFKFIHDFANANIKHIRNCTPGNLYLLYNVALNCLPGRYKEIHLVNKNLLMNTLWKVIKPFLPVKIKNRVILHASSDELVNHFPASVLPEKYGGTLKEYRMTEWMNRANEYQHNFPLCGQSNFQ